MADLDTAITSLQDAVRAINNLTVAIKAAFPQADTAITHSATAGGDTLPAAPSGFLTVTVDGVAFKIPLYDS